MIRALKDSSQVSYCSPQDASVVPSHLWKEHIDPVSDGQVVGRVVPGFDVYQHQNALVRSRAIPHGVRHDVLDKYVYTACSRGA
jgi:hypothetical protein